MIFSITIPTYNRAHTLPRALDSLIAQTHQDWRCVVVDDGSTDNTAEVVGAYEERDERIALCQIEENRGEVFANGNGLGVALISGADVWTRMGSDDWFGPTKLEIDARCLGEGNRACYGPAGVVSDEKVVQVINLPCPTSTIREQLLLGRFMCSWANIAIRVDVLREVRERFGGWVGSGLRHMTDFHLNSRIARVADFAWRGVIDGRYTCTTAGFNVSPRNLQKQTTPDAFWLQDGDGLSSIDHEVRRENERTLDLIKADERR